MSVCVIVVLAIFLGESFGEYTTQNQYSVHVNDGTCYLGAAGGNNLFEMNGEWYDKEKCMKYECRVQGGKAVVTQHRCEQMTSEYCWIKIERGVYPNCCYGRTLCDDDQRRKRHSFGKDRYHPSRTQLF